MKKNIKVISLLMATLICGAMILTGCGQEIEKADVTGQVLYDLFALGDTSKVESVGLSESDAQEKVDEIKDSLKTKTRTNFLSNGITIDDSKLDEIVTAQLNAHKKLTGKVEITSEDKDSVQVKLTTNYINIKDIDDKAANDAVDEVKALGLSDYTEAQNKLIEVYERNVLDYLAAAEPSSETLDNTFTFSKQKFDVDGKDKDVWMPDDMENFTQTLFKMITNN